MLEASAEKSLAVMPAHLLCVCAQGQGGSSFSWPLSRSVFRRDAFFPDGKAMFLLWVTKSGLAGASLHLGLQKPTA